MNEIPRLLVYCEDQMLLESRCRVLQSAHFAVDSALSPEAFTALLASGKKYSLAVLCHSTSEEVRYKLAGEARAAGLKVFQIGWAILPGELILEIQDALRSS